ncbi:uncharacterized protein LODBEIA_P48620 [Lodderomyces beijingensis]|uniref:Topoisomerase I damage affected protein 11 n=1 Tax=Lodderomyces beijingensis TaxID=1775926 RepID=A0ABP0ZSH0_9ASCO
MTEEPSTFPSITTDIHEPNDNVLQRAEKTPSPTKPNSLGLQLNSTSSLGSKRSPRQFKVQSAFETSSVGDKDKENQNSQGPTAQPVRKTPLPKSKGLNIFAVSSSVSQGSETPLANSSDYSRGTGSTQSHHRKRSSTLLSQSPLPLPLLSEASDSESYQEPPSSAHNKRYCDFKYDIPMPSQKELLNMNIDEQLRVLALKEMCLVEIKDQIQNLNTKLSSHEGELHHLREIIQKSLYQEIGGAASNSSAGTTFSRERTDSNPHDQAIESLKAKRRSSSINAQDVEHLQEPAPQPNSEQRTSKFWGGLSKPFNMLQQLDNLIQNEFEKSLVLDNKVRDHNRDSTASYKPRNSEDSVNSIGSISSPLHSKSSNTHRENRHERQERHDKKSEDMLQSVSSSIWSFVNEVKTNVLSSLNEDEIDAANYRNSKQSHTPNKNGTAGGLPNTQAKQPPESQTNGDNELLINFNDEGNDQLVDMGDERSK